MSTRATITPAFLSVQSQRLLDKAEQAARDGRRYVLGIAGIPASGKSSLAVQLMENLDAVGPGAAALVPMDGFHMTNAELDEAGLRDKKGAPETFHAADYVALVRDLCAIDHEAFFPVYDRSVHDPVADAGRVTREQSLIVTEGNYLLLDVEPWHELDGILSEAWWLDTSQGKAHEWMVRRHVLGGRTEADAQGHYERSDKANTELVMRQSREPRLIVSWPNVG